MMLRAKATGHVTYHVDDPAVLKSGDKGRGEVDWTACPPEIPRSIHVVIDAKQFTWDHHPGLTITHEPVFNQRMIYNPPAMDRSAADSRQKIDALWMKTFGRVPDINSAISQPEAVSLIRTKLNKIDVSKSSMVSARKQAKRTLDAIDCLLNSQGVRDRRRETGHVALVEVWQRLYDSPLHDLVRPVVNRIKPFVLQGNKDTNRNFLVVSDPRLEQPQLNAISGGQPYIVWVDLSRLRPVEWRSLPRNFVTMEGRELHVIWNHFHEVRPFQMDEFAVRPWMIHQYGQKIARYWQRSHGAPAPCERCQLYHDELHTASVSDRS